jgi:hypothetical protein
MNTGKKTERREEDVQCKSMQMVGHADGSRIHVS